MVYRPKVYMLCSVWPKEVSSAINTISNAFRKTHKINDLLIITYMLNRYVKGQEAVTIKFSITRSRNRKRSLKSAYDIVKIVVLKRGGIRVGRIRIERFHFLLTPLLTPSLTIW